MEPLMIQLFPEGHRSRKNYVVSLIAAQKVFMMPGNVFTAFYTCTAALSVLSLPCIQMTGPPAISHATRQPAI